MKRLKLLFFVAIITFLICPLLYAEEMGETTTVEVWVDARSDDHKAYYYEANDHTRQLPSTMEIPGDHTQANHYDGAVATPYGFIKGSTMTAICQVFTRQQLERIANGKEFKSSLKNRIGIIIPEAYRHPNDMILFVIRRPEDKIFLSLGVIDTYTNDSTDDSWQAVAAMALETLNVGATYLEIYGEGADKIMRSKHWGIGTGGARVSMPSDENVGAIANGGTSFGKASAKYDQPIWLHASAGRWFDRSALEATYIKFAQTTKRPYLGRATVNSPVLSNLDISEKIDFSLIEDYFLGRLFQDMANISEPTDEITNDKSAITPLVKKLNISSIRKPFVVYYDYNKADIRQDQIPIVKNLGAEVEKSWRLWLDKGYQTIIISGCSSDGNLQYNFILGGKRYHSIADYLAEILRKAGATKEEINRLIVFGTASNERASKPDKEKDRKTTVYIGRILSSTTTNNEGGTK